MAASLAGLPDDVLRLVFQTIPKRTLGWLSLVCKRWRELAKPILFADIDLSELNAAEAKQLYRDLCASSDGDVKATKWPVTRGPLFNAHIKTFSYSFIEDLLDEEELRSKLATTRKIFESIQSVAKVELELSLLNETSLAFKAHLLPAIKDFFGVTHSKVAEYELSIDANDTFPMIIGDGREAEGEDEDETEYEIGIANTGERGDDANEDADGDESSDEEETAETFETSNLIDSHCAIAEFVPRNKIISMHMTTVSLAAIPEKLASLLTSPNLKNLSFKECGDVWGTLPSIPNLESLHVTWDAAMPEQSNTLASVFEICIKTQATLKCLILQDLTAEQEKPSIGSLPGFTMSALSQLRVRDSHCSRGFLLDYLTAHISLPKLTKLAVEIEDLLGSGQHLYNKIHTIKTLRTVKLIEGGTGNIELSTTNPQVSTLESLTRICNDRKILLECATSCRCDSTAAMAQAFGRLQVLSETLTSITFNLTADALQALSDLPMLEFPHLRSILVNISGSQLAPLSSSAIASNAYNPSLSDLIARMHMPQLEKLGITIFTRDASTYAHFDDLSKLVMNSTFPKLSTVSGALMSSPEMSKEALRDLQDTLHKLCQGVNVDCSSFNFIPAPGSGSEEDSMTASDDETENESDGQSDFSWSASDSAALWTAPTNETTSGCRDDGSSEAGSEESESAESGFAEGVMLQRSKRSPPFGAAGDSDSESSDADFALGNASATSTDSWMTDNDD